METKDLLTIIAVILGPILAVQAQKIIERHKEKRNRKFMVFYTLMATRASRLSYRHVEALNMIDIEFYGRKFGKNRFQSSKSKAVTNAWKNYNDHLNNKLNSPKLDEIWLTKSDELFTQLLYTMSNALGYDYDEVQLKRDCYSPHAHYDTEQQINLIRQGLADVFEKHIPIPIIVSLNNNSVPEKKEDTKNDD